MKKGYGLDEITDNEKYRYMQELQLKKIQLKAQKKRKK